MDITNVINKIQNDYLNTQNIINKSIKYSFNYHNSHTNIYYTQENGLQNQIILVICVNKIYYLTTIYFSFFNNQYQIKPYIPDEIYPHIRKDIFEEDKNSPVPYFQKICSVILNSNPLSTNYKAETNKYTFYIYKDHKECPFFETFIRKNMSPKMKEKIWQRYDKNLAKQIIKYCNNANKTLRFTPDFNKAHDIIISMNN